MIVFPIPLTPFPREGGNNLKAKGCEFFHSLIF